MVVPNPITSGTFSYCIPTHLKSAKAYLRPGPRHRNSPSVVNLFAVIASGLSGFEEDIGEPRVTEEVKCI